MYAYHAPSFDDLASNSKSDKSGILSPAFEPSSVEDHRETVQYHEILFDILSWWSLKRNKDEKNLKNLLSRNSNSSTK